jgi:hypothetical protein
MRPGSAEADREMSFGAGADLKAGVIGLASIEFAVVWTELPCELSRGDYKRSSYM